MVTAVEWGYRVAINGTELPGVRIPLPLSINHGRSSAVTQPDAPAAEFTVNGAAPPADIGDTVVISLSITDLGSRPIWVYDAPANYTYDSPDYVWDNAWNVDAGPRFTGRVSGMTAREADGVIVGWDLRAIGLQATYASRNVTLTRPQETDVARVQAIATAAGMPLTVVGTSTINLVADSIDRDALAAIYEVCESAGGLLWQAKDGGMFYGTANHRQRDPVATLSADSIIDGLQWRNDLEQVLNYVVVKWGPEGSQSQNTHRDDASIAAYDQRRVEVTTLCAAQADADQLGLLILARRAVPYWLMDALMVHPERSRADTITLATVDVGTPIFTPSPEDPSPAPVPWVPWVVEGWVEQVAPEGVTIQLSVTDAARWAATRLRTWDEARQFTWQQEAAGSWLDALIVEGT